MLRQYLTYRGSGVYTFPISADNPSLNKLFIFQKRSVMRQYDAFRSGHVLKHIPQPHCSGAFLRYRGYVCNPCAAVPGRCAAVNHLIGLSEFSLRTS
jgi:hypothetical protein